MIDVTRSIHASRSYGVLLLLCVLFPATVFADAPRLRRVHGHHHADRQLNAAPSNVQTSAIPVGGFTPLVVEVVTSARLSDSELFHMLELSLTGAVLTGSLATTYAIGRFDTGSVVHLTGFCEAASLGLSGPFLTGNTVPIIGIGGVVEPLVSQPIGVFVDGLSAIDPATGLLDRSGLVGHSNVAVLVGPSEDCAGGSTLPTVIGTPLSAFYTTVIRNDQPIRLQVGETLYETPSLTFYEPGDVNIPTYRFRVPLALQPSAFDAGYISFVNLDTFEVEPILPTTLIGSQAGAHFFAGVNLSHGDRDAIQQAFLVDTGTDLTLMSSFTAGMLGVDPQAPDFTVDVEGIGGTTTNVPGFIVDRLDISAFGGVLTLQAVPIVLFDVQNSSGGALDGIIGTNLFADRNIVFAGDLVAPFMEISEPIGPANSWD